MVDAVAIIENAHDLYKLLESRDLIHVRGRGRPRRCPVRRVEGASRCGAVTLWLPSSTSLSLPGTRGRWADRRSGRGVRARDHERDRASGAPLAERGRSAYAPLLHNLPLLPRTRRTPLGAPGETCSPPPPVVVRDPLDQETRGLRPAPPWMRICAAPKGARGSGAGTLLRPGSRRAAPASHPVQRRLDDVGVTPLDDPAIARRAKRLEVGLDASL